MYLSRYDFTGDPDVGDPRPIASAGWGTGRRAGNRCITCRRRALAAPRDATAAKLGEAGFGRFSDTIVCYVAKGVSPALSQA